MAAYRFAPQVAQVIQKVAQSQVENLRLDEQQKFEQLERELETEGIEFKPGYLQALTEARERLIEAEIGELLRKKLDEEEAMLLIAIGVYLT